MPELSFVEISFILVGITVAATFQGVAGFGFSFFAIPVLSVVDPRAIPVTTLVVMLPMTIGMAYRERGALQARGVLWLIGGRIPGTAVGIYLLSIVSRDSLTLLFGCMMLVGVALLSLDTESRPNPRSQFGVGILSGVMGTVAAIGGPPQAVLYRNSPGPELRSMLAVSFFAGIIISLGGLALADLVRMWQVALAVVLLPAMLAGFLLAVPLSRWVDARAARPVVLGLAALFSIAAIVQGLFF